MKNKRIILEGTVFKIRHRVSKLMLREAAFDVMPAIKNDLAISLGRSILENKKAAILETPISDVEDNMKMLFQQEVEFSIELIVMTRAELKAYIDARIANLTYAEFTELKKSMRGQ